MQQAGAYQEPGSFLKMDKITLRNYLKEIENQVDRGETDQAIAHCRHILKTYPKNLATYRLLGKAFLESRRYGDAADVFQRVLSGVPDDFVSHVGMSIIREDEGNQDAAIWHMERAFEIQPYNSAIQDELRRLYGRRDGLEPPKVRLTRGALARMYARGNLYQQSIGELRAALAEDPQRSDLQVLLARMYFMAGQKVEAVETCSNLLKRLPYCLEANRIISAILPETERKEETQVYRERVMALDPYLVLASPFETNADNVRDQVVVIEKLDYKEGQLEAASQPAWAASLGVTFEEFKSGEEPVPDWLAAISQGKTPAKKPAAASLEQAGQEIPPQEASAEKVESVESAEEAPLPSIEEEGEELPSWISFPDQPIGEGTEKASEIPDWMKEAGWEASTGGAGGTLPPFEYPEEGQADLSGISKAELPPWLQALAPEGLELPAALPDEDDNLEFMPWLQEGDSESQTTELAAESGWMEELDGQPLETSAEVPDWLGELGEAGQDKMQAEPAEEIPEWLKETPIEPVESSIEGEGAALTEQEVRLELPVSEAEQDEEMPDWLKEIEVEPAEEEIPEEEPAVVTETAEEAPAEETAVAKEIPEWLAEIEAEPAEEEIPEEEPAVVTETAEEAPAEETAVAEEIPEWLAEIEAEPAEEEIPEEAPAVVTETAEEAPAEEVPTEELPEWVAEIDAEPAEPVIAEEAPAEQAEEIPTWLQELGVTPIITSPGEGELEGEDLTPLLEEAAQFEEMPDWLKAVEEEPGTPTSAETKIQPEGSAAFQEEAEPAEVIPDWIKEMGTGRLRDLETELDQSVDETAPAVPESEEIEELDWLQIIGEEPIGTATAFITEEGVSGEDRHDFAPDELEALLADTQPIRLGDTAPVVPFNEILEEIDTGLQGQVTAEELAAPVAEESEGTYVGDMEFPAGEALSEETEAIEEAIEAVGHEEFEGALSDEIELPPEELLSAEAEAIVEEAEATKIEYAGQALVGEIQLDSEDREDLEAQLSESEAQEVEKEATLAEARPETAEAAPTEDMGVQPASLDWLESLAAKHGIAGEELFTSPEARPAETPAGVEQELAEASETLEEAELAATTEPAAAIEELKPSEVIEETRLEELAEAEQLEENAFSLPEWSEEALPAQEEPVEEELPSDQPDWLKALQAEDVQEPITGETAPLVAEKESEPETGEAEEIEQAELPDWLRAVQEEADQELAKSKKEQEIEDSTAFEDTEAAMAWLEGLATKQGVPEQEQLAETSQERVETAAEDWTDLSASEALDEGIPPELSPLEEETAVPTLDEQEATEAWLESLAAEAESEPESTEELETADIEDQNLEEPELPEWLAESEIEDVQEEEWTPPVEPVKAALRAPRHGTAPLSQPPLEPVNINKASLVDLEVLPGVGFILAQNILTYREAFGPYATVDELIKVPGITAGILAEIRENLMVPAVKEAPPPVEPELLVEAQSELIIARNRLAEGDVEGTVAQYSKLIKNRELLPEIIRDLKEALYRFPVDISLWQTLGDAYMRSDQLTEALEAYTKAEELLR
jgi:competence ComEA-like helix-hairpin-helix protein